MKKTFRLLAVLLAALILFSFAACGKKGKDDKDDDPGDDFSGSISDKKENEDGPSEEDDDGSGDATVTVTSYEQLSEMKRKGKYVLGADIDLTGKKWTPLGTYGAPFEGTFDGAGHKITGLSVTELFEDAGTAVSFTYSYCGFFGAVKNAEIKNTVFENAVIDVSDYHDFRTVYAGIICGLATDSRVTGCSVGGSVTAKSTDFISCSGGIAGAVYGAEITGCVSNAVVLASESAVRAEAGGIAGASGLGAVIRECVSAGKTSASCDYEIAYAGGIVGYCYSTRIEKCSVTGEVYSEVVYSDPERGTKGAAYSGGLCGTVASSSTLNKSVILKSYCLAPSITAKGNESAGYAAGLCGSASFAEFKECYSVSGINSSSTLDNVYAAGIADVIDNTAVFTGCFSSGDVTADAFNDTHLHTGTCFSSAPEDISGTVTDTAYCSDTVYKLNGTDCQRTDDRVIKNGSPRTANVFVNLSLLSQSLGWNISEWKMENGNPVPIN